MIVSGDKGHMLALGQVEGIPGVGARVAALAFGSGARRRRDVEAGAGALTSRTRTETRRASSWVSPSSNRAFNSSGPSGREPDGGGGMRRPAVSPNQSTR